MVPQTRSRRADVGSAVARAAEVALALVGLAYFLNDAPRTEIRFLALWDSIAVVYLMAGFFVVRRSRLRDHVDPRVGPAWSVAMKRRLGFLLTVVASLTGLTAAVDVLVHGVSNEKDGSVRTLGVIAVICAWTLLHAGYAAFYRHLDQGPDGHGLRFPGETNPELLDYLYFSITLGVSFAVSDVEIVRRRTRWHVMIHQVVSFFYNTAVLAIAVSVITGAR
jgi:Protein of unknown function (DUF1345)